MALTFDRSIVGSEFDVGAHGPITQAEIDDYAGCCGDASPAAAIAPVTFVLSLRTKNFLPPSLANLGSTGFDAGKDIEFGVPVCVGDSLVSRSVVHEIYEKTGRSGTMAFMVLRTVITNQQGLTVAVIDQRMMFR